MSTERARSAARVISISECERQKEPMIRVTSRMTASTYPNQRSSQLKPYSVGRVPLPAWASHACSSTMSSRKRRRMSGPPTMQPTYRPYSTALTPASRSTAGRSARPTSGVAWGQGWGLEARRPKPGASLGGRAL